jgi:hypothetical protein
MTLFGAGTDYVEAPRQLRDKMTVCIGSICNMKKSPGAIMLGLDMRVTHTMNGIALLKHDLTSKLFDLPYGFIGVVAGYMPHCETLISYVWDYMEKLAAVRGDLQLDHIVFAARNASEQLLLSLFDRELVNKFGITRNEWIDRQSDAVLKMEGRVLLSKIRPDASCLVGGFLQSRPVLIRLVGKNAPDEIVGHCAIGIGAKFALQKLATRMQGPYCSIQRTALAFSEALRFAKRKSDGFVGPPAHCLVLEPALLSHFDSQSPVLREWSRTIKASMTDNLDDDECWEKFRHLLEPVPKLVRQSGVQTLGQAQ